MLINVILDSIVVSIPACHAGDRGSIPRRGVGALTMFQHIVRLLVLIIIIIFLLEALGR